MVEWGNPCDLLSRTAPARRCTGTVGDHRTDAQPAKRARMHEMLTSTVKPMRLHQVGEDQLAETCNGHRNKEDSGSNCLRNRVACSFSRRDKWHGEVDSQDRKLRWVTERSFRKWTCNPLVANSPSRSLLQDGITCEALSITGRNAE